MLFLVQLKQATMELTPSASRPHAKKIFIKRDREAAYERLYKDYLADDSVYNGH